MGVIRILKRPDALLLIGATMLTALLWQFRLRFPFDDTFISFRYAEHLASGHGLVWNIGGPHTEGYTNFLFIALLSIARWVTSDLLAVSQLIGLVSTIATGILLYRTAAIIRGKKAGVLAALLYFLTPLTWINALSGMETSLFVMLVVLAISRVAKGEMRAAYAIAVLATLTRPEGALLAVVILIAQLRSAVKNDRVKMVGTQGSLSAWMIWFVFPSLLYAAWKYFYFGALLPNSFYVKVLDTAHSVLPGLQYVRLFVTSVLILISASLGIRSLRDSSLFTSLLWVAAITVFYLFVLPLEGLYDRFLWPAFAVLCMTAAVGIIDVNERWKGGIFYPAFILLAAHILLVSLSPRTNQSLAAHEDIWDASMDKIITQLKSLSHSDSLLVGYGDAGYVVYKTGMQYLDLFGLNDMRIAHAKSREARAAIVKAERPDILLLPVRLSDTGFVLIEDAYGLARTHQFVANRYIDAFPYPLGVFVNRDSHYAADLLWRPW